MPKIQIKNFNLHYGEFHALHNINMDIRDRCITALIGPSGCGKSTLVRSLNRMNDLIAGVRVSGQVLVDGQDIYTAGIDVEKTRKKVGMVFQRPNPFPLSIFDNVSYGLRVAGVRKRSFIAECVEKSLRDAWLWDSLKDKLHNSALALPMDQQQRLCVARLLAIEPEVILMDEPCSALDPIATAKIEELMYDLKRNYCIVIVTHNMQQAARVSDYSGYMLLGDLVEYDDTKKIFTKPTDTRTQDYITGRYG
jgi:phosphate transport system ATP-binding protein